MFDFLQPSRKPARYRWSGVASTLAHAALIGALLWVGRSAADQFADAGAGDGIAPGPAGGGGGGGQQVTFYDIVAPAPAPSAVEVEPVPPAVPEPDALVLNPPTPAPTPARADSAPAGRPASVASAGGGSGGGEGTGSGGGTGSGTGAGSGGGSGGGTGGGIGSGTGPGAGEGRITPPETDLLLIPPPRPRNMAARTVVFILAVDAEGVVRDVELQPPTGDRRYDAALRRMALDWRFKPARDAANRPVAVKYPVTLTI
ncbi:hypothetical protein BH23GEM5_BH23GEM5_02730 [soil metagenome]